MKPTSQSYNILIVDDIPNNIKVAANILQQQDYKLFFATTGKDALTTVRNTEFDLILLDVMMLEMDGFQVCEQLKQNPAAKDIPIIFLTAKTDTDSIIKGFDLGAVDYVTKPFNGKELFARVKTHLALRRAQHNLQEANATKDKFFSIIAHDLRSPFTALLGMTELLNEHVDSYSREEMKTSIQKLRESSSQVFALLENLLTWSRLQRGLIECSPEELSLYPLVRQIGFLFRSGAEQKHIQMQNLVPEDAVVYADRRMLDTVLRNLLSNAIKFTTAEGTVDISATAHSDRIVITVADTGTGITQEALDKIFRIDAKYSKTGTAGERGTGLGLILCKELVERNHGTLKGESVLGQGSAFTVTLPNQAS
jgi:signal transduction histidine kinase